MSNQPQSLIKYGEKVQYGLVQKNEREMRKNATNEFDENDPISLKSYLDTILPPKESTEEGQIYMQFVSCVPADKGEVVKLSHSLENQMKVRQAKETGLCNNRDEIYSECFDELIRQITLNCLERGILLTRIKKELRMTINSYQSLYESSIAYGIRTLLLAEEEKKHLEEEIKKCEEECSQLDSEISDLEHSLRDHKEKDDKNREEKKREHEEKIEEERKKGKEIKDKLKDKLSFQGK